MAAIPVGLAEYDLATKTKKVFPLYADGSGEDTAQANFCTTRSYNPISRTISGTEYQVAAFYDDPDEYVVIAVRNNGGSGAISESDAWTTYVMDGTGGRPTMQRNSVDNHNTIALGIDSDGYIHICWGMHNDPLLYKRSANPLASWTGTMTADLSINAALTSVTYPHFATDPTGKIYFMCRGTGGSGNGNSFIYSYTTSTTTWASLTGLTNGLLIDGEGSAGAENAYPYKIAFTSDFDGAGAGYLVIAWVWDDGTARHDVCMVKTDCVGNWKTWAGATQTIPITTSNDDVIDPVATSLEIRGEEVLLLDSNDYPILIYKHNLSAGTPKDALWVNAWSGSAWVKSRIDWGIENDYDWAAEDAVIDGSDQITMLVTNKGNGDGIFIFTSNGTDYSKTWKLSEFTDQSVVIGTDVAQTRALIQFDPYQASTHGRLHFLVPLAGDAAGANTAFPDGWDFADKATISNPTSAVDDTWFIIDASRLTAQFWAEVKSDLSDVRLSDGAGGMLPCYVHVYNYAGQTGMIFGRWVGPLASSGTQEVWVHYGNSAATTPAATHILGRNNIWRFEVYGAFLDGDTADSSRLGNTLTATGSPTTEQAGPFGTLKSSLLSSASTQYFSSNTINVGTTPPVALAVETWIKPGNTTANEHFASVTGTGSTNSYLVGAVRGDLASPITDPVEFQVRGGAPAATSAYSGQSYTSGAWYHVALRSPSQSSRSVVLNGVAGTAETTSTATGINCVTLGALRRTTVSNYFNGNIGPTIYYNGACPSDAEIAHRYAMGDQATFWGTWADANPAASGLLLSNAAYFARQM